MFLYPALPRVFKNFEVVCEAVARLGGEFRSKVEVQLTIDGSENRYAQSIVRRYGEVPGLRFVGRQDRVAMARLYARADVVLFPSKLETWGLPISEAKGYGKPLLVSDLPYAHETVGSYEQVSFLDPERPEDWAAAMEDVIADGHRYQGAVCQSPPQPYAAGWPDLLRHLTEGL